MHSYVDKNVKCSSYHRKYSSDVPCYLHNKPRAFVKPCMEKLQLGSKIDNALILKSEEGRYIVKNSIWKFLCC